MNRLFVRRRDRRIEVRLNDGARAIARHVFDNVVAAEANADHEWYTSLLGPIDPSADHDDPLAVLSRQSETTTNAELAIATWSEGFLNDAEAWAWLCTLQVGLRALYLTHDLRDPVAVANAEPSVSELIVTLQSLLWALADVL